MSVDPAWISAGSGLVGAVIGAGTVIVGKWFETRHQREMERRRQMEDLLARFWEAADRYWRMSQSLYWTVREIMADRRTGETADLLESRRYDGIAKVAEAELEAKFLLARMRLLGWPIADAAQSLLTASNCTNTHSMKKFREARTAALGVFEEKAVKALGD